MRDGGALRVRARSPLGVGNGSHAHILVVAEGNSLRERRGERWEAPGGRSVRRAVEGCVHQSARDSRAQSVTAQRDHRQSCPECVGRARMPVLDHRRVEHQIRRPLAPKVVNPGGAARKDHTGGGHASRTQFPAQVRLGLLSIEPRATEEVGSEAPTRSPARQRLPGVRFPLDRDVPSWRTGLRPTESTLESGGGGWPTCASAWGPSSGTS